MEFAFRKTEQLSVDEKKEICNLCYNVFNKEVTVEQFRNKFERTCLGYSYHGMMLNDGKIVGCYSAIPYRYKFFGKEYTFALSVDTMIDKNHRGNLYNLKQMANLVYAELEKDQIPFVFGAPNDKIYPIRKKILTWSDIGIMDFFILPINIGKIKKYLTIVNPLSRLFAAIIMKLPTSCVSAQQINKNTFSIEQQKDTELIRFRYAHNYTIVKLSEKAYMVYRLQPVNNIRAALIFDVNPLEKAVFESSVKYIYENERSNIDAIVYMGNLNFRPKNLIKVPERFRPKTIRVSGKIIMNELIDDRIFNIREWNVNLSNFDF